MTERYILGLDEAGRGAVVGPLVISAAMIEESKLDKLKELGVKDSKKLSKQKRESIEKQLKDLLNDSITLKVKAKEIDKLRKTKSLNQIECDNFIKMINTLKPDKAIIDAPEANTVKIKNIIENNISKTIRSKTEIVAENYADDNFPIVSAASILAKVTRDNSVESLERIHNEKIGIGYPSDKKTIDFLKRTIAKHGKYPEYVRKSWITAERIINEKNQNKLSNFCD